VSLTSSSADLGLNKWISGHLHSARRRRSGEALVKCSAAITPGSAISQNQSFSGAVWRESIGQHSTPPVSFHEQGLQPVVGGFFPGLFQGNHRSAMVGGKTRVRVIFKFICGIFSHVFAQG